MKKIGEGLSCSVKKETTGDLVYIKTIEDVINLIDNAKGKICIVDDAGITTLSPILSDLAGAVCTTGGAGSHPWRLSDWQLHVPWCRGRGRSRLGDVLSPFP